MSKRKQQEIINNSFARLISDIEDRLEYHNSKMQASKQASNYDKYMEHLACHSELILIKTLCEINKIVAGRE